MGDDWIGSVLRPLSESSAVRVIAGIDRASQHPSLACPREMPCWHCREFRLCALFGAVGAGGVEDLLRPGLTLPRCASDTVAEAGCVISHVTAATALVASVPLRYAAGVLTCATGAEDSDRRGRFWSGPVDGPCPVGS